MTTRKAKPAATLARKKTEATARAVRATGPLMPMGLYGVLRDRHGDRVGTLSGFHDGTPDGMRRETERLQGEASRRGYDWGGSSSWIAADAAGEPSMQVSHNLRVVEPLDARRAAEVIEWLRPAVRPSEPASASALDEALGGIAARGAVARARAALPSTVYGRLRTTSGRDLAVVTEGHDGTVEGVRAAAARAQAKANREAPRWSGVQSSWIATDASGRAAWAISPNLAHVSPVGSDEAAYTLGDLSRAPRKDNPARAERTSSREVIETVGEGDEERETRRWVTDVEPPRLTPGHAHEPATVAATRTAMRVVANSYSLADGRAAWPERLGSGNFGIAYKLETDDGPSVVKISAATNLHGRPWTREEQTRNLMHEAGVANELTELGFRCMPLSVFVRFAGGTPAVVREYGDPAGRLTPEEYASLEADLVTIEREHGWRVNDDLALYRRRDGSVYVGDVGFWQAPEPLRRGAARRPWKAMDSSLGHLLDQVQREHEVPSVTSLPRLLSSASILSPSPSRPAAKPRSALVERFEAELAEEFLESVRRRAAAGVPIPAVVDPMVRQAEALIAASDLRRGEPEGDRRPNPNGAAGLSEVIEPAHRRPRGVGKFRYVPQQGPSWLFDVVAFRAGAAVPGREVGVLTVALPRQPRPGCMEDVSRLAEEIGRPLEALRVRWVWVDEAFRRRGLGVALYATALREALARFGAALLPDECFAAGTTKPEAMAVWTSDRFLAQARVAGRAAVWRGGAPTRRARIDGGGAVG